MLNANAIGSHQRHEVGRSVALLRALPVFARIHRWGGRWLTADGRGIQQQLRAHERHRPGAFWKPLIPADAHTDAAVLRVPHAESCVTRCKVALLLISRTV